MADPLVSIIIPCYNAESYVADAIGSALAQTYQRVEVIAVDDGSTDGTAEVLRSLGSAIRWETRPNRGGCAARNRGLQLARGDLIQFLDADDLLHPNKLELQVAELERCGADIVFCNGRVVTVDQSQELGTFRRPFKGGDAVEYVLAGVLTVLAPIHRADRLRSIGGFREHLPCAQERDLHLRLACNGAKFRHLDQTLYTVRRVANSVSSNSVRVLDQHADIVSRAVQELQSLNELSDARARALAGLLALDARAYIRHGHPEKAEHYFELARTIHRHGGMDWAYRPCTRYLVRFLGACRTERLVGLKRSLTSPAHAT